MQVAEVIVGDPFTLRSKLQTLAGTNNILNILKTKSAGSLIIISDDSGSANQTIYALNGDPDSVSSQVNTIVASGKSIDILAPTFSASYYLVVAR